MKFTIKKKIDTSLIPIYKGKSKFKIITEIVEIPELITEELIEKTIAVISELLDRTWDELEELGWSDVEFPLVPFPFFTKYRTPEDIGIGGSWIYCWLDTSLANNTEQRSHIILILRELGGLTIEHNPAINKVTGELDGNEFQLTINRSNLMGLDWRLYKELEKINKQKNEPNI